VSVQLALAGRAVASTGTATEEASQSGMPMSFGWILGQEEWSRADGKEQQ